MKNIFKYIIAFITLIISFNLLLFLSSLFPSSIIEENVKESAQILSKEGNLYDFGKELYITNNNFTDALMINEAYSIDNKNPVYSYMSVRKNYKEGQTKEQRADEEGELITINDGEICAGDSYDVVGELQEFVDGKTETSVSYARYWHGYLPILRVLLIFLNITQIRYILLFLFIGLFIYMFILIKRTLNLNTAIIFAYSLIVEGYFFVSYSLESAPVFIVMMIACVILLKRIDKIKNFYMYIFIIASITNFVDYLTVPIITLAMPLYLYILYINKTNEEITVKGYFKIIFKTLLAWGIGYALTWSTKWILYDIIYQGGLLKSAIAQALYRNGGNNINIILSTLIILKYLIIENSSYIILYLIIAINILIYKYVTKSKIKNEKRNTKIKLPVLIIAMSPFVWFLLLANHTVIHFRFTYRNMIISVFGILIIMCETLKNLILKSKK